MTLLSYVIKLIAWISIANYNIYINNGDMNQLLYINLLFSLIAESKKDQALQTSLLKFFYM
jgi:hypothetical protein